MIRTLVDGCSKIDRQIKTPPIEVIESLTSRAFQLADIDESGDITYPEFATFCDCHPLVRAITQTHAYTTSSDLTCSGGEFPQLLGWKLASRKSVRVEGKERLLVYASLFPPLFLQPLTGEDFRRALARSRVQGRWIYPFL